MEKTQAEKSTRRPWSEDDIKLLKKLFPSGRAREISEQTGRTLKAVKIKAYNMGIMINENRFWSTDEIKLLKKLYPKGNTKMIAEKLDRPLTAVRQKAYDMGMKTDTYNFWTEDESLRGKHIEDLFIDFFLDACVLGFEVQHGDVHMFFLHLTTLFSFVFSMINCPW